MYSGEQGKKLATVTLTGLLKTFVEVWEAFIFKCLPHFLSNDYLVRDISLNTKYSHKKMYRNINKLDQKVLQHSNSNNQKQHRWWKSENTNYQVVTLLTMFNTIKGIWEHREKAWTIYEQTKEKKYNLVFLVKQKYAPIGLKIKKDESFLNFLWRLKQTV